MAKSRPRPPKNASKSKSRTLHTTLPKRPATNVSPATLLASATSHLQTGSPALALPLVNRALSLLPEDAPSALPALSLLGEIQLELGNPEAAREAFEKAVRLDPEGLIPESEGGGAEKFLWLAQLCEEGGKESLSWFERGVGALEKEIVRLEAAIGGTEEEVQGVRAKLAAALCGMVEVWMTDLSLDPSAEANCESLITRALLLSPIPHAPTLQTLASIRLSQSRLADAQSALTRSLALWSDLPPEDPTVPDFPTRISLSRLLMEAEMEEQALEVLERLVEDDEESVEAWYLGGWCLFLLSEKGGAEVDSRPGGETEAEKKALRGSSREWLGNSLTLFEKLEYEDERLKEHALELVETLNMELGAGEEDAGEWEDKSDEDAEDEDEDSQEDEDMEDGESKNKPGEDHEMNET